MLGRGPNGEFVVSIGKTIFRTVKTEKLNPVSDQGIGVVLREDILGMFKLRFYLNIKLTVKEGRSTIAAIEGHGVVLSEIP